MQSARTVTLSQVIAEPVRARTVTLSQVIAEPVRPSHFCPEHISKSIEGNLLKLDTLIEVHDGN